MIQIYLDTETTGIERGACIIELAAIMVDNGEIVDTFHKYCKPYRPVHQSAFAAHGISNEFLSDSQKKSVYCRNSVSGC